MFEYIDDKILMDDIKILMKIPAYRACLFHKVEELKDKDGYDTGKIQEYRELENMVDPGKKTENKEPEKEIKKTIFEIHKSKTGWQVNPVDIPQEIVNHIISFDLKPGLIKMEKFKLPGGQMIDLSFEMQSKGFIAGSIIEKSKTKKETPKQSKQSGKMTDKKEVIKTIIAYLLNNEDLFNWMANEFFESWKPLIDNGCITTNER